MKKTFGALAGVAILLGGTGVAGATEFARGPVEERPPMTLTPDEGLPGSGFTASGDGCESGLIEVYAPGPYVQDQEPAVDVALDGSWTAEFVLAGDVGANTDVRIEADCMVGHSEEVRASGIRGIGLEEVDFQYQTAFFSVVLDPSLTLSPETGPAGSTFTVSGGTCFNQFSDEEVVVTAGAQTKTVVADSDDGSWSTTFDVPSDAAVGSTIDVGADCTFPNYDDLPKIRRAPSGGEVDSVAYDDAVFTVTGGTATTQPSTPSTPTTADGAVAATAATPTTARPTFTG